jgi:hypothetical protein
MVYDEKGRDYNLPPAIINEPVGFGEDKEKVLLEAKEAPEESTTLTITLRNASTFNDDQLEIEDN